MAKSGPKPYAPSAEARATVRRLAQLCLPHKTIAVAIGVSKPTLYKCFRAELDDGLRAGEEEITSTLFELLREGPPRERLTAAIFLAKVRLRWSERHQVEHTGSIDVRALPWAIGDEVRELRGETRAPSLPDGDDDDIEDADLVEDEPAQAISRRAR